MTSWTEIKADYPTAIAFDGDRARVSIKWGADEPARRDVREAQGEALRALDNEFNVWCDESSNADSGEGE